MGGQQYSWRPPSHFFIHIHRYIYIYRFATHVLPHCTCHLQRAPTFHVLTHAYSGMYNASIQKRTRNDLAIVKLIFGFL